MDFLYTESVEEKSEANESIIYDLNTTPRRLALKSFRENLVTRQLFQCDSFLLAS
jgi:hypothetical protein